MTPHERSGLRASAGRLEVERASATAFDPVTGHLSARALVEHLRAHTTSGDVPLDVIVASLRPQDLPADQGRFRGVDAVDRSLAAAVAGRARSLGGVLGTIDDGTVAIAVYGEDPASLAGIMRALRSDVARNPAMPEPQLTHAGGAARDGAALIERALVQRGADHRAMPAPGPRFLLPVVSTASLPPAARSTPAGRMLGLIHLGGGHEAVTSDAGTASMWDVSDLLLTDPPPGTLPLTDRAGTPLRVAVRSRALAERPELTSTLRRARESGVHVCLTGYGSGRDPLDSLDELPIDALEPDHALVRGALVSRADRAVLWSITTQARRFGLALLSHRSIPTPPLGEAIGLPDLWTRLGSLAQDHLEDSWTAGLTAAESALLLNAARERTADGRRWTRYDVALAWGAAF